MLLRLRMTVRRYSTASSSLTLDLLADCFPSPCVRLSRTLTTTEAPPSFIHPGTPPSPLDILRNRMKDFPRSLVPVYLVRPPTYTPASSSFRPSRFPERTRPSGYWKTRRDTLEQIGLTIRSSCIHGPYQPSLSRLTNQGASTFGSLTLDHQTRLHARPVWLFRTTLRYQDCFPPSDVVPSSDCPSLVMALA
jgi:hypothetical protein